MSKTICIYHSRDLDGWMSAAIVKKWWLETQVVLKDIITIEEYNKRDKSKDPLVFLGWDYGDAIPDLTEYDKVIMVDVSFPISNMIDLIKSKGNDFIWIDHHISAINNIKDEIVEYPLSPIEGIQNIKYAACELTWQYFFPDKPMPEIVRLLGRYDCFGHKGTDEEETVLEFQYAARTFITNYEEAYESLIDWGTRNEDAFVEIGQGIHLYLCTEAKQTYSKAFPIKFYKTDGGKILDFEPYNFLCVNQERFNPINFGIDYHKEGYDGFACFHYEKGKWCFSLYNDNGEVDCSVIAKQYGGGGHKGASGFVCNTKTLIKILGL